MKREDIEVEVNLLVGAINATKNSVKSALEAWLNTNSVPSVEISQIINDLESYPAYHNLQN